MTQHAARRFYSPREARDITGLSAPTLWRLRRAGKFPEPAQLSPRRVGYPVAAIEAWISAREQTVA